MNYHKQNITLIVLFSGTLFTSALLMFVLQPIFGKILLPLLGGSPAVWNTCMVFYQSLLFLGYLYAHWLCAHFKQGRQILIHVGVIGISLLALPLALPENSIPPASSDPTFWLLKTLFLAIGLPFFVVSTTAPLIQKWFSLLGHKTSEDPYFLYAASNTGSLIALLSYPFFLEPNVGLASQRMYWSLTYGLFCVLIAGCAFFLWKSQQSVNEPEPLALPVEKISWNTRLHWMALAFVPSSLLLGLTNFISTDIASVPLLWIIPLSIYLLSFVIVFSRWNDRIHPWMLRLQPIFLMPFIIWAFINPADLPYWAYLVLHVIAFFFAIMVCHGELAKQRPHPRHLTSFYLIMSFAGMLGGMFNTFVAPFIFNGIYEYPLMIVAALLLRPGATFSYSKESGLQILIPVVLLACGLLIYQSVSNLLAYFDELAISLIIASLVIYALRNKTVAYALSTGVIIFLAIGVHSLSSHTLYQQRSFFGVLAVRESVLSNENHQPESYHELFHGTTKHGAQRLDAINNKTPLTYYSRPGPMGQLFKVFDKANNNWTIGVVGLGAGALLCYAKPTQNWVLYEIDPLVIDIAENPDYFSYIKRCGYKPIIRTGDARLSLKNEPNGKFDLLVIDAFSSDSVPTHLLTREAISLYFEKLKADGILAIHITNRHFLLKKVLSVHAESMHFAALIQEYVPQHEAPLVVATDWVVMAKNPQTLLPLSDSLLGNWEKMPLYFDMLPWTDDFTNIITIWK